MSRKDVIYPFVLECISYNNDSYWKNIFEDLSFGINPIGTYISKNYLICSLKGREFNYKLEKKDPKVLYTELYNLLCKKLGLLSDVERNKKKRELENNHIQNYNSWSNIKKKSIKNILIEKYVISKSKKYNLDTT